MEYFGSIFFGTFVLEDVSLAVALGLVADGKMHLIPAFLACFLGISLGDIGLYLAGFLIGRWGLEVRFKPIRKIRARLVNKTKSDLLTYTVILSRFVPGTRLPTYLLAGVLRFPFWRFVLLTFVTVLGWVGLAFAVGRSLNSVLMNHLWLTIAVFLVFLRLVKFLVPKLSDRWERKALRHSWRRYLTFEFWPATLFYLPIVGYYVFLSIKHRSLFAPFYANPKIENAGLIGESKWDFLGLLDETSPSTLKAVKLEKQTDFAAVRDLLDRRIFSYPFVLKPDVGQRGFGVRVIRNDFDLTEYLLLADFDMILQEMSGYSREAGIFYIRPVSQSRGFLFSITDKRFPTVIGDGRSCLGDLILNDKRARLLAGTYFSRHRERLNEVPEAGAVVPLAECGNHCQGAIFLDGHDLNTPALADAIDKIARSIPQFHFGRFDLRYRDEDSLREGRDFEIIEINGAGSEATHIWDPETRLIDAYRTLFRQWRWLFEIGAAIQRSGGHEQKVSVRRFLAECMKVFTRKEALSISS